jgi:hypothetical protein
MQISIITYLGKDSDATVFEIKLKADGNVHDGMLVFTAKNWWMWEQARTRAKGIQ